MLKLTHLLPPIYADFLPQNLLKIEATETKATCDNCLRSRDKRFAYTYQKNLKCCTFHPFLPNYAVGALLQSASTSGTEALKNKIKTREFAIPMGVLAPYRYQYLFLTKEEEQFGNDKNLLCPYYSRETDRCSIWLYRGVVCTTFYCRSDHGQNGLKFWAVLSDYLSYVEMALAEECLVQMDFSPRDLSDQLTHLNKREFESEETDQTHLSESADKKIWNGYDDKCDFYKKCFAIVGKLDRRQFKEIIGAQGLGLEEEVLDYANRRQN